MEKSTEQRIVELYNQGVPIKEIQEELSISPGTLYYFVKKNGLLPRHKKSSGKKFKVCPKCKTRKNPPDAKFCCMCGESIITDAEKCVSELREVLVNCKFMPRNVSEESAETIRKAIKLLEDL